MEFDINDRPIRVMPMLPLRGVLVFPHTFVNLDVGRKKSINAIEEVMSGSKEIFLSTQREAETDEPNEEDIYPIGVVAEVKQILKMPGGTMRIMVEGRHRARLHEYLPCSEYIRVGVVEHSEQNLPKTAQVEALVRTINYQFEQYVRLGKKIAPDNVATVAAIDEPGKLCDVVASHLTIRIGDKQRVLEAWDALERLQVVSEILAQEMEVLELEKKISAQVRKQMEKTQKEYYLREQIKAIHKELGDKEDRQSEFDEIRDKIEKAGLPDEAREKALKELERLEKMPPMVAEGVVVRNYLDWMVSLPWSVESNDTLDLNKAARYLDEDHWGLIKPKERILEYLAIRKLTRKIKGPILCLVGPPGVGKTSLGKSIARSLNRKFVRMSLGGIRDEAEIRGHRRTYVGSMPGRIIQGIKQAGTRNPVFLLDEIDKMTADFRGDPASALLEVLDPEQNNSFSDHYLEVPFDLSKVMFITTANTTYSIPAALLDRMEIIEISSYTEEDKLQIALRHLVPKQIQEHGLKAGNITIKEAAVRKIIREYTREAGVRTLERQIGAICRKVAREVVADRKYRAEVGSAQIGKYLGIKKYKYGQAETENQIGVATGLAWTQTGGDLLAIEIALSKGKGGLTLTGKLGDVMKESAQAAFTYVKSKSEQLGIDRGIYDECDIHVHVPEGAIPKDGPSAGITIATALASALSRQPVRKDVAMTGEITLRGRVLPIGGLTEKTLAAHRAGIKHIIIPDENRKDLEDIPANVRRKMHFISVEHMDAVLEFALIHKEKENED